MLVVVIEAFPRLVAISTSSNSTNFKCLRARRTAFDAAAKTSSYVWHLKHHGGAPRKLVIDVEFGNSTHPTTYYIDNDRTQPLHAQVIYSDYQNCVVARIPTPEHELLGASLVCVLVASIVAVLVVMTEDSVLDCGEMPDWRAHVDPAKRVDVCSGKPCEQAQCDSAPVDNDTCRGTVRPYADRCRCCEACVPHLGKGSDCSNRPSDLHELRECGPGLFCNKRTCLCMEYVALP
ncbi:uncharacterized protein LOC144163973 [Haemaphysalis longicornis]